MCTVIVAFNPQNEIPISVASNRDESPNRKCTSWKKNKSIFCPIDSVGGGTWIGVNHFGLFAAITNWNLDEYTESPTTRGKIVLDVLKSKTIEEAVVYCMGLSSNEFKSFNLLIGNKSKLYHVASSLNVICNNLHSGLYICTGLGLNTNSNREKLIRESLSNNLSFKDVLKVKVQDDLYTEDAVCVDDKDHEWETVSSALLELHKDHWDVEYTDCSPCKTDNWNSVKIPF